MATHCLNCGARHFKGPAPTVHACADCMTDAMLADGMEYLLTDLPETLSLDDLKHHPGLRRIILAADALSNKVDSRALDWAKSQ